MLSKLDDCISYISAHVSLVTTYPSIFACSNLLSRQTLIRVLVVFHIFWIITLMSSLHGLISGSCTQNMLTEGKEGQPNYPWSPWSLLPPPPPHYWLTALCSAMFFEAYFHKNPCNGAALHSTRVKCFCLWGAERGNLTCPPISPPPPP